MEKYEGDYGCQVSEDGPCRKGATMVYREPFTPARVAVLACSTHADDLESAGYHYQSLQLARVQMEAHNQHHE